MAALSLTTTELESIAERNEANKIWMVENGFIIKNKRNRHTSIKVTKRAKWGTLPPRILICPTCSTQFKTRKRNRKFCSRKCARTYRPVPIMEKTCPTCSTQFKTRKRNKIYCSGKCARIYNNQNREVNPRQERACSGCSTTFKPINSNQIYCTPKCRAHS